MKMLFGPGHVLRRPLGFFPPEIRKLTGIMVKPLPARPLVLFSTGRK